jgi:ATP-dependent Clp protease ATP-binding subunit ClpB
VLLQLLDDGRLTDGQGRTVDFRNTVVILTSNLGSQHVRGGGRNVEPNGERGVEPSGERAVEPNGERAAEEARVKEAIRAELRPELLNRIDEVVVFHSLGRPELARIVELQLQRLSSLMKAKQLTLELTDAAKEAVGQAGYDPVYGARPLKRALQRLVLDPLALKVLKGDYQPGDTVKVDAAASGELLTFTRGGPAA